MAMGELPLELDAVMVELASGSGEHELGLDATAMALHDNDEARGTGQAGSVAQGEAVGWLGEVVPGLLQTLPYQSRARVRLFGRSSPARGTCTI